MLESLLNKKVEVLTAFSSDGNMVKVTTLPSIIDGVLVAYDEEFIKLDNNRVVGKNYIISIKEK